MGLLYRQPGEEGRRHGRLTSYKALLLEFDQARESFEDRLTGTDLDNELANDVLVSSFQGFERLQRYDAQQAQAIDSILEAAKAWARSDGSPAGGGGKPPVARPWRNAPMKPRLRSCSPWRHPIRPSRVRSWRLSVPVSERVSRLGSPQALAACKAAAFQPGPIFRCLSRW